MARRAAQEIPVRTGVLRIGGCWQSNGFGLGSYINNGLALLSSDHQAGNGGSENRTRRRVGSIIDFIEARSWCRRIPLRNSPESTIAIRFQLHLAACRHAEGPR
jgi:hypothetical protein